MSRLTDEQLRLLDLAAATTKVDIAGYTMPNGTPTYDDKRIGRMMARDDWWADLVPLALAELRAHRASSVQLSEEDVACLRWLADQVSVPPPAMPSGRRKNAIELLDRLAGAK